MKGFSETIDIKSQSIYLSLNKKIFSLKPFGVQDETI